MRYRELLLIYFSGTGNTELITEELKKRFEKRGHLVTTCSLEDENFPENCDLNNKIIGFGFPVYKFSYPSLFTEALYRLNRRAIDNPFFLYSTYARFPSDSFNDFKRILNRRAFHFIAEECFKAPSCGLAARKESSDDEYRSVMFFEDDIGKRIDFLVEKVISSSSVGMPIRINHSPFRKLKLRFIDDIELCKYPELQINRDRCSLCKICVFHCPIKNFTAHDDHIGIKDIQGCLHCLRCMNHCPSQAISFGKLSEGQNSYTLKKRNELFQKSLSGHREDFWRDFDKTIVSWRRKTIRYWLRHRRRPEI